MTDAAADARRLIASLDLTNLDDGCTSADIDALVARASTPAGPVAAICIWPRFVKQARAILPPGIRLATVVNFPAGGEDVAATLAETRQAVADGADEIDLVVAYRRVAADPAFVEGQVRAVKSAAGAATLKTILETGELADPDLILSACEAALAGGADFLKTSTGKTPVSATPEAARILLQAIAAHGGSVGFKPSGGIKSFEDAKRFRDMAAEICGEGYPDPSRFRLGASGVLTDLLAVAAGERRVEAKAGY
ncbi:deoxyribose-phosphate aldolase [Aureimonas pseudogalii]|uniref:Deoxyribose-phosphate aldolase n=1 Tax=Aureimonas pseudogalii TaxID=1744844 RepID=A0A7W6EHQ0_9HYPH|nr:deoxyribose-phosphate aldolase [Aureimonas pseudogalii]MBB3998429.1 deoxyribose-phosphate aldolase [Aureimonas pseudogalii]